MNTRKSGFFKRFFDFCFGLYMLVIAAVCVLVGLLVTIIVPVARWREVLTSGIAKSIFVLSFVPVDVIGREHLPDGDCVVVGNHMSYVDGLLLRGYLPARFSFVIKGEVRKVPVLHFLLRRSGSRFVDRNEGAASARDARQIVKAAKSGQSLAVFPEGTFKADPGLLPFRPGAFAAAVAGKVPTVPIVLAGTRHMLPAGRAIPRFSRIRITILPPIDTAHTAYASRRDLAAEARRRILEVLDEPDLDPPK
ncbi:MAG: lysophospholipid acyltransferase family protein [Pseudomonadota bacterium]